MIQKQHKKESAGHAMYRLLLILVGASLAALSIERFLVPNQIIDGGNYRDFAHFRLRFAGKMVVSQFCDACCAVERTVYVLRL